MGNMTISTAILKAYANEQRAINNERYSKQTQSNPISNAQTPCPACQARACHVAALTRNDERDGSSSTLLRAGLVSFAVHSYNLLAIISHTPYPSKGDTMFLGHPTGALRQP